MRIAYRRLSGAIGVTDQEIGARGLWWEKRRALLRALQARGHQVDFVGRLTKPTAAEHPTVAIHRDHELLMLEFGSNNEQFYGRDLEISYMVAARHRGPIVFLCDDPDLPLAWDKAEMLGLERWTFWLNATRGALWPGLSAAAQARVRDFPFASLMEARRPSLGATPAHLVYLGRPHGRMRAFRSLIQSGAPLQVHGKPKDWARHPEITVLPPPHQPQRAAFYAAQRGALVVADGKHKTLGWRTGRAYHAVLAGCPALPESDHEVLRPLGSYRHPDEIAERVARWSDPHLRAADWRRQHEVVMADRELCAQRLDELGL